MKMDIIIRARGGGKTVEMIKLAADQKLTLVVPNREMAYSAAETARHLGLDIMFPITFSEFLSDKLKGSKFNGFLIDNADILLQYLAGNVPVMGITLTQTDD